MLILMVMANEFGLMVMVSIDASLMIIDVDLVMAMAIDVDLTIMSIDVDLMMAMVKNDVELVKANDRC